MKKHVVILVTAVLPAVIAPAHAQGLVEDFNGATFPPSGWTIVDNQGLGQIWQLNTYFDDDNWTGGDGTCADVNTDWYGGHAHGGDIATELISPEFLVPAGAMLEFDTNYQTYFGLDYADTDISIDDGANWINLLSWHGTGDQQGAFHGSGVHISLDLGTDYAGETARIRFNHYNANWEWYWQIDNFVITPEPGTLSLLILGGLAVMRRRNR